MRYGIIEDINDPEMLGRARVRIHGIHNPDRNVLPTEKLQWAIVMNPTTTPGVSGKGDSPFLLTGSWVAVEFADNDLQIPIIIGTFRGNPVDSNVKTPDKEKNESYVTDSSGNVITDSSNQPVVTDQAKTTQEKENIEGWFLGKTAIICETGSSDIKKSVMMINDYAGKARGDAGGASYGAFQFASYCPNKPASKQKILNSPIRRLCRKYYPGIFDSLSPGTAEFDRKWKEVTSSDLNKAVTAQSETAKQEYYVPMVNALKKKGLVLDNRGAGVKDLILATSVQMWIGTGSRMFAGALAGKDIDSLSDADIINLVCDYKANNVSKIFRSSSVAIQNSIAKNRYGKNGTERRLCLALCGDGQGAATKSPLGTRDDPNGKYPEYTNESDVNRLSRNQQIDKTATESKDSSNIDSTQTFGHAPIQDEGTGANFSEPKSPYNAKYPYNHVKETSSGHVVEFDDTPGHERINIYHRTGSFVEFHPDGKVVMKSINDSYQVSLENQNLYCEGELNIVCNENATIVSKSAININATDTVTINAVNDVNVRTQGKFSVSANKGIFLSSPENISVTSNSDINVQATGNYKQIVNGAITSVVDGDRAIVTNGSVNEEISGNRTLLTNGNCNESVFGSRWLSTNGTLNMTSNGQTDIQSPASVNVKSGGTMTVAGKLMQWISGGNIIVKGTNIDAQLGSGSEVSVGNVNIDPAQKIDYPVLEVETNDIDITEVEGFAIPDGAEPDAGSDTSTALAPTAPPDKTPVTLSTFSELASSDNALSGITSQKTGVLDSLKSVAKNQIDTQKNGIVGSVQSLASSALGSLGSLIGNLPGGIGNKINDSINNVVGGVGNKINNGINSVVGGVGNISGTTNTTGGGTNGQTNTSAGSSQTQDDSEKIATNMILASSGKEPVCWYNPDIPKLKEFPNSLRLTENITLGMMLNGKVTTARLPTSPRTVYYRKNGKKIGVELDPVDFVLNLQKVALYVIEPLIKYAPSLWNQCYITSTLRTSSGSCSQHTWGQAVDIQFKGNPPMNDLLASFEQFRKILKSRNGYDQIIIEYHCKKPVMHISFSDGQWKHPKVGGLNQCYTSYTSACSYGAGGIADKNHNTIYA